jgi:hypothetical protein
MSGVINRDNNKRCKGVSSTFSKVGSGMVKFGGWIQLRMFSIEEQEDLDRMWIYINEREGKGSKILFR